MDYESEIKMNLKKKKPRLQDNKMVTRYVMQVVYILN